MPTTMPRAREGGGRAQSGRSACRCPLVATVLLHVSLARFVLELWLYYLDLRLHFPPPLLPSPPSSSESATSCGRQRIKYRARYRGGRRCGQLKCAVGVGATFFVFFLGSLQTISGLSFICIKKYLHSTVNEIKSGVGEEGGRRGGG